MGGVGVQLYHSLPRRAVSFRPRPLYPRIKTNGTHWIRGWVRPRAGLDALKKAKILLLPGIEPRSFIPYLYWLTHPGSHRVHYTFLFVLQLNLITVLKYAIFLSLESAIMMRYRNLAHWLLLNLQYLNRPRPLLCTAFPISHLLFYLRFLA
jgi:hypothetical protein